MTIPLITLQDMQEFISTLSSNIDFDKEMNQHILDAMEFDLQKIMGESFYLDLLSKFSTLPSPMDDLWNGVEYTHNGKQFRHQGFKSVLVYHAYARYLPDSDIFSTPFGMVHNNNEHSVRVSDKKLSNRQSEARSMAGAHESRVVDYINRNSSLFPLFNCTDPSTRRKAGVKIRNIG